MIIHQLLVKQYALCVYVHGTRTFDTVVTDYHEPVKEFAAEKYTLEQIDSALIKGHVTEQEYQDTIAYTTPIAPTE